MNQQNLLQPQIPSSGNEKKKKKWFSIHFRASKLTYILWQVSNFFIYYIIVK